MKSFTLLFLVFLATGSTCQVIVSANNHFKLFQNYTSNGKEYISQREQPMLFEGILNTSFVLKTYKKTYISVGLSYKRIKFEVKDVIKGIEYRIFDNNDNIIDSGFFESHMNYRNTSNNFGLSFEYGYQLSDKKWKKVQLGLNLSTYVFEINKDSYYGSQDYYPDVPPGYSLENFKVPSNGNLGHRKGFLLSQVNLSTFYRHNFQLADNFSLAARISLGTNLYSDWDQFKKYAWLGVGLEMGFGKVKQIGGKEKNNSESQK